MLSQRASFQELELRKNASKKLLMKYPEYRPFIIDLMPSWKSNNNNNNQQTLKLDKTKFLVAQNKTIGHLLYHVRTHLILKSNEAVFFLTENDGLPATNETIGSFYNRQMLLKKPEECDGFVYLYYCIESTFGSKAPSFHSVPSSINDLEKQYEINQVSEMDMLHIS